MEAPTNANLNFEVNRAYQAMEDIANTIWNTDGMAETCIILSKLLPTGHPDGRIQRLPINTAYRQLVRDYRDRKCIYIADMEPQGPGANFLAFTRINDFYVDDTHPRVSTLGESQFFALIDRTIRMRRSQEDGVCFLYCYPASA
jgi:hypothetical protein